MTPAPDIRAVVIDDEPLARDELIFLLEQCEGVEILGQADDATTGLALVAPRPQR